MPLSLLLLSSKSTSLLAVVSISPSSGLAVPAADD
jgi:hypothetical protein